MTTVLLTALAPAIWGTTYIVSTELIPADRPLLTALRTIRRQAGQRGRCGRTTCRREHAATAGAVAPGRCRRRVGAIDEDTMLVIDRGTSAIHGAGRAYHVRAAGADVTIAISHAGVATLVAEVAR